MDSWSPPRPSTIIAPSKRHTKHAPKWNETRELFWTYISIGRQEGQSSINAVKEGHSALMERGPKHMTTTRGYTCRPFQLRHVQFFWQTEPPCKPRRPRPTTPSGGTSSWLLVGFLCYTRKLCAVVLRMNTQPNADTAVVSTTDMKCRKQCCKYASLAVLQVTKESQRVKCPRALHRDKRGLRETLLGQQH